MIGDSLCRYKTNLDLHFGQTTAKSAGVSPEKNSIGINSDSFFASRLTANAMFFAVQLGLGQSKEGSRRRSSAMVVFNFCLCPPWSMLMIRSLHDALDLQFIHDNIWICFGVGIAGMKNIFFVFRIKAELFQIVSFSPSYNHYDYVKTARQEYGRAVFAFD